MYGCVPCRVHHALLWCLPHVLRTVVVHRASICGTCRTHYARLWRIVHPCVVQGWREACRDHQQLRHHHLRARSHRGRNTVHGQILEQLQQGVSRPILPATTIRDTMQCLHKTFCTHFSLPAAVGPIRASSDHVQYLLVGVQRVAYMLRGARRSLLAFAHIYWFCVHLTLTLTPTPTPTPHSHPYSHTSRGKGTTPTSTVTPRPQPSVPAGTTSRRTRHLSSWSRSILL